LVQQNASSAQTHASTVASLHPGTPRFSVQQVPGPALAAGAIASVSAIAAAAAHIVIPRLQPEVQNSVFVIC
jgi:hypothetical protein